MRAYAGIYRFFAQQSVKPFFYSRELRSILPALIIAVRLISGYFLHNVSSLHKIKLLILDKIQPIIGIQTVITVSTDYFNKTQNLVKSLPHKFGLLNQGLKVYHKL
jgi:hypothetical protein